MLNETNTLSMLLVLPLVHGLGKLRWVTSEIDMDFDRENL
jgi:hypothetical protein